MPAWKATCAKLAPTSPESCVEPAGRQCAKDDRDAAIHVERIDQPIRDILLVDVERRTEVRAGWGGTKFRLKFK